MSTVDDTTERGEPLEGGIAHAHAVFKKGNEVNRPAGPHTPAVHKLLRHLRENGFNEVPEPIAIEADRERVSFIPGDVPQFPYPSWCLTEETLVKVAKFLKRYHIATSSFPQSGELVWSTDLADPEGGTVVCHNDMLPENVVFNHGEIAAVLDFDFAAPGRPLWDIAKSIRMWVPLDDPSSAATYGMPNLDPFRRLKIFCDAYELDRDDRIELLNVIDQSGAVSEGFIRKQVAAGIPSFVEMWEKFHVEQIFEKRKHWLTTNRDVLVASLLS